MFTVSTLINLTNGDGLTLKNGKAITYKSGYQVATDGEETQDAYIAFAICQKYGFTCGIWFENGIYYIDHSHRVATKREALKIGRACNQISVLRWSNMSLVYC